MPDPRPRSRRAMDPISLVEAAYRFEGDEDSWLSRIRTTAAALLPTSHVRASLALVYRAPDATNFRVDRVSADGLDGAKAVAALQQDVSKDPQYLRDSLLSRACDLVSAVPRTEEQEGWKAVRSALGVVDGFVVNGLDGAGLGVMNLLFVTRRPALPGPRLETIARVAAHVVAGLRIRKRLASAEERLADADAVSRRTATSPTPFARRAWPSRARAFDARLARWTERAGGCGAMIRIGPSSPGRSSSSTGGRSSTTSIATAGGSSWLAATPPRRWAESC